MELYVCERCKKLTQSLVAGVCTNCYKSQIADFQRVKAYLWEHPNTKLQVVAKECNVSISQIREWVKEEKLELFKPDPSITCKRCGQPIFQGCYKLVTNISIPLEWKTELENLARIYSVEEGKTITFLDLIRGCIKAKYQLGENADE